MCSDCGCGSMAATTTIPVVENLLSENDRIAAIGAGTPGAGPPKVGTGGCCGKFWGGVAVLPGL